MENRDLLYACEMLAAMVDLDAHVEHSEGWRIGTSLLYACEMLAAMVDLDAHVEHSEGWRIGTSLLYVCEMLAAMVDLDAEMDGAELTMSVPLRELRRWFGLVPEDAD